MLKDALASSYFHKDKYSKTLEKSMQIRSIFELYNLDSEFETYFTARTNLNMGLVYQSLKDYDTAMRLFENVVNNNLNNNKLDYFMRMAIVNNLSQLYFCQGDVDKLYDLLNVYKESLLEASFKRSDSMYYSIAK